MSEERDYGLLYRILDVPQKDVASLAREGSSAKERIERYRHDLAGFLRYYFPDYITLEPAEWQQAIFDILEQPERNTRNGRWRWRVTDVQAGRLALFHRPEYRHLPHAADPLRAIALCAPREQGKSTVFARLVLIWLLLYGYVRFAAYFRGAADLADSFLADTMVEFTDGAVIAQMGCPDMRQPIAFALGFPHRLTTGGRKMDFSSIGRMSFEAPDLRRFPCLQLAYEALKMGGNAPCALNAANEIAVAAYLKDMISFYDIARIDEKCLRGLNFAKNPTLDDIFETNREIASIADGYID